MDYKLSSDPDYDYDNSYYLSRNPRILNIFIFSFYPSVGIFLIGISTSFLIDNPFDRPLFLISCILLGTFLLQVGYATIAATYAKYKFTPEGVIGKFPLQAPILVRWDEFQQVCVCYTAYHTQGERTAGSILCI